MIVASAWTFTLVFVHVVTHKTVNNTILSFFIAFSALKNIIDVMVGPQIADEN